MDETETINSSADASSADIPVVDMPSVDIPVLESTDREAVEIAQDQPADFAVDAQQLRKIVEGAILAAGQPLTVARIIELFDPQQAPAKDAVLTALVEIQADCAQRGFELKEVASGWRFQVREDLAPWVNRLWEEKPQKYSRALLETLALIAYRQPITRGDIEEIRGVAVSSHIMKTLLERDWVKVVGHRDVPGRPSLYATTRQFLDYFNLKSLEELPSLGDIRDLDELTPVLELNVDDEGLGEPDTDLTEEASAPATETETDNTELAELVDGESAFEEIDQPLLISEFETAESIDDEAVTTNPELPGSPHNA